MVGSNSWPLQDFPRETDSQSALVVRTRQPPVQNHQPAARSLSIRSLTGGEMASLRKGELNATGTAKIRSRDGIFQKMATIRSLTDR